METYKPNKFAKLLGVSVKTLQRWDKDGVLPAFRNPKGRRYYTYEQYMNYYNLETVDNRIDVVYARVSTKSQSDSLKNQIDFILSYCKEHGIKEPKVVSDFGSGLNYNRKQWNVLLEDVVKGTVRSIIISSKDRFVRFGFDWFNKMCAYFGTKIVVINDAEESPQKELVKDIISILHVFSCRLYGLRKYKTKIKYDNDINQGI